MEKEVVEEDSTKQDDSGVAETLLLTEEREDGVETTISDVEIERVLVAESPEVEKRDLIEVPEYRGISSEELAAVVHKDEDERFSIRLEDTDSRVSVSVQYRVSITVDDTGLGKSRRFAKYFSTEEEAESFRTRLDATEQYQFYQEKGVPELGLGVEKRYKDFEDEVAEEFLDEDFSPSETTAEFIMSLGLLFLGFICSGVIYGLMSVVNATGVLAMLFMLVVGIVGAGSLFIGGLLSFLTTADLLKIRTAFERASLDSEEDDKSVFSADALAEDLPENPVPTYTGVSLEREEGRIIAESSEVDASWEIETYGGVIINDSAKEVLREAELPELEDGQASLRVQKRTSGTSPEEPRLKSENREWWLLPPKQST